MTIFELNATQEIPATCDCCGTNFRHIRRFFTDSSEIENFLIKEGIQDFEVDEADENEVVALLNKGR